METSLLCPAELVLLNGMDAIAFAQSQFTTDVASVPVGGWQWSAWLDAQGRARHFFALLRIDDTQLLAWQPLGSALQMRDGLARFVLRSKVSLDLVPDWSVFALPQDRSPMPPPGSFIADRGGHALALPGNITRIARLAPFAPGVVADPKRLNEWRLTDIEARLPLLASELDGKFVPQALDLEHVGAIRFDKGCYPGQEIAARLHFRGGNKRGLRVVQVGEAVSPGAPLADNEGRTVGHVLYSATTPEGTGMALAVTEGKAAGSPAIHATTTP